MKNTLFIIIIMIFSLSASESKAQCTGTNFYDTTVTGTTVYHPTTNSYISAVVCAGGLLIDSASCCTRITHILAGGTYEIGGNAYGSVFVQNGGTFNANNSTIFFGVTYETGATILNYNGPKTLCALISFSPSSCLTGIDGVNAGTSVSVYFDSVYRRLNIDGITSNSIVSVFDMTGKMVKETTISQNYKSKVDVSALFSGIYCYRILNSRGNLVRGKFVLY